MHLATASQTRPLATSGSTADRTPQEGPISWCLSSGEGERVGSVEVESAHDGSVSVGSGSSEAFGDVVVTTRDGSASGGMFVTTGGACLGTAEGSADTGGDVTLRAGRSDGTTVGTVTIRSGADGDDGDDDDLSKSSCKATGAM